MSAETLTINHSEGEAVSKVVPRPQLLSSEPAGWKNIHLAYYHFPPGEVPELASMQHIIVLPLWKRSTRVETTFDGKPFSVQHDPYEIDQHCVEVLPAFVPLRSNWNQDVEFTHCYLEPAFLRYAAYESVDPDRVEVKLSIQKPDPLIWQICLALKTVLETDPTNSKFYADSMATALAAHVLKYYATRKIILPNYEEGLTQHKLKQAFEYIDAHLQDNVSLADISRELGMSQYYFCRLFKQSTGMTPHAYLIQQRVERSKQLLRRNELTINEIAIDCGFANPSHFAKWFRRHTGLSPKQFRMI